MDGSDLEVVFILGPPGAGKGTICKRLDDLDSLYGYNHLSVGDFLRKLSAAEKFPEGVHLGDLSEDEIREHVKNSKTLPTSTIVPLLREELAAEQREGVTSWIIDGFPRSVEAAEVFEDQIAVPALVVLFECPKYIAQDRFTARKRSSTDGVELFETRYVEFEQYSKAIGKRYADKLERVDTTEPVEKSSVQLLKLLKRARSEGQGVTAKKKISKEGGIAEEAEPADKGCK